MVLPFAQVRRSRSACSLPLSTLPGPSLDVSSNRFRRRQSGLTQLSPGTLVRDLAIRQAKNNLMGQDQLKGDVNTILAALRAYKSPLGGSSLPSHLSPQR